MLTAEEIANMQRTAQRLVSDAAVIEVFARLKQRYLDAWSRSAIGEESQREAAYYSFKGVEDAWGELKRLAQGAHVRDLKDQVEANAIAKDRSD